MYYYKVGELILQSCFKLFSFDEFICDPSEPDVTLVGTDELPSPGKDCRSGSVVHRQLPDGWFFYSGRDESVGLFVNPDYSHLRLLGSKDNMIPGEAEWHIRIALECRLIRMGCVSLHAAAVETQGEAYAFTAPSGVGKSTRANAWSKAFGAKLINGDRPLIQVKHLELYGVPWDGKEQCFRNVHYPLKAICEVRRSESTYVRAMSFDQRRKLLICQSFIPMWDSDTAAIQLMNISRLAAGAKMVRAFCGPEAEDAKALYSALKEQHIIKEAQDMKAKSGFVLRNIVDEFILMPTGDNIGKFNGTVLLNEVSAFVWEKLQNPVSRDDLLKAILDEFEVEKAVAAADLDALLAKLKEYDVIEDA